MYDALHLFTFINLFSYIYSFSEYLFSLPHVTLNIFYEFEYESHLLSIPLLRRGKQNCLMIRFLFKKVFYVILFVFTLAVCCRVFPIQSPLFGLHSIIIFYKQNNMRN